MLFTIAPSSGYPLTPFVITERCRGDEEDDDDGEDEFHWKQGAGDRE
ncbi:MAG TPA: hypothetical protein VGG85_12400 [Terracidiphilus sp.]